MKPELSASVPFPQNQRVLQSMMDWAEQLIIDGPDPRNGARPYSHFTSTLGQTITPDGMGWEQAFALFTDEIVPSTRPFHHPTSLSFVAAALARRR